MANRVHGLKDVDHEDTILRTFILFVQAAHTVLKYADAHFYRKERLSVIKVIVLRVLAANGGAMTPSEIAEWTFRERHDITTLIDRMKRDGLVRVERNNRDKRFVSVSLTAKGRKVLKQAMPVAREIVNQVMLSISEGGAVPLENSLKVLRQNAHDGLKQLAKCAQPQPD
ncbi:MAG: MarR family transcriptional regulator [Dehalococcoidales bacterium]